MNVHEARFRIEDGDNWEKAGGHSLPVTNNTRGREKPGCLRDQPQGDLKTTQSQGVKEAGVLKRNVAETRS